MTQIIKCKVENILGVKHIEFTPNGHSVTIGGANGQGKTSAIWALVMALAGKAEVPVEPLRRGAETGEVAIELDKLHVRLIVKEGRKTELKVESLDGAKLANPQAFLNGLFKNLSFDPGQFKAMEPAKRLEVLTTLLGLDLNAIAKRRQGFYEARTEVGREVKELEGKAHGRVVHDDVPAEEVSADVFMTELEAANEVAAKKEALGRDVERAEEKLAGIVREQKSLAAKIVEHREAIKALERSLADADAQELKDKSYIVTKNAERVAIMVPDVTAIKAKHATVQETNRKVRANKETADILARLTAAKKTREDLTTQLDAIDREKEALIASKEMPIPGMSISDAGIIYNGIPFEQLAESEQWRICTGLGCALNRGSILFMRQSGGLDKKNRQAVRETAAACGVQLFMEVVDDAEDVQILISEGEVAEDRLATTESAKA